MWRVIQSLRRPDRLILFSTHSMEEAETLCTRLGIIANGTLRCIGTSVHLKNKFGRGYTLTINLQSNTPPGGAGNDDGERDAESQQSSAEADAVVAASVDSFVCDTIGKGEAELTAAVNKMRRYSVPKTAVAVSDLFSKMEENKKTLKVSEFSVTMTTLEEVFVSTVLDAYGLSPMV